jgi:hypothetical protein
MDVAPRAWPNARDVSWGTGSPDGGDRRLRIQHRTLRLIAGESDETDWRFGMRFSVNRHGDPDCHQLRDHNLSK